VSTETTEATEATEARELKEAKEATIKEAVRVRYATAASRGSCCGTSSTATLAESGAAGECCGPVSEATELDLGCGNPLPVAGIRPGETVLDLGSGSGSEVLRAARMVGPAGRAIGVDMTDEMLELARANQRAASLANVEFLKGEIESLPLPDSSVDVIVSNCVLNLSPDKTTALGEAFRVLRPGGRFVVADVVVEGSEEPDTAWRNDLAGWASCTSGAMTEAAYAQGLREAGFTDVKLERIASWGGDCGCAEASGPALASDLILARKPEA
jgi:arsenite methyltransferase